MPRTAAISNFSLADLEQMIHSRQRELRKLEKPALGGTAGRGARVGGARSRARNEINLPDAIAQVLSKSRSAVAVGDIMEGVLAAGYKSNSANFRGIVNQALIKDKRFKSAGRGLYEIKASTTGGGKKRGRRGGRKGKGAGETKKAAGGTGEATAGE